VLRTDASNGSRFVLLLCYFLLCSHGAVDERGSRTVYVSRASVVLL
jgi:hypothetical protein